MSGKKRNINEKVVRDTDVLYDSDGEPLEFEDDFEDEFESEHSDDGMETNDGTGGDGDVEMEFHKGGDEQVAEADEVVRKKVWLRSRHGDAVPQGSMANMDFESSAYDMLHRLHGASCLSFTILRDRLGEQRARFPHEMYLVAGSQAPRGKSEYLYVMRLTNLKQTKHDSDDEYSSDSDEDDADQAGGDGSNNAVVNMRRIPHSGAVNRVRSVPQNTNLIASWSERGAVHLWDIEKHVQALAERGAAFDSEPLLQTLDAHSEEGYALDFSPITAARLLTGACDHRIFLWEPSPDGKWHGDKLAIREHTDSVEDLQWSPSEADVFASCSVDKTIKIWDTRDRKRAQLSVEAHNTDVNVISWNRVADHSHLLLSGADDGEFKVWDLRHLKAGGEAAVFNWHQAPITSVEWSPHEASVLAVTCEEQATLWDLSLEYDDGALPSGMGKPGAAEGDKAEKVELDADVPPQLLFVHMGLEDIKEVHWHQQIPGTLVCTAQNGMHVWKPYNI